MPSRPHVGRRVALSLISAAAACLVLALWMGRQASGPEPGPQMAQSQPAHPVKPDEAGSEIALALCDLEQGPTPIIRLSGDMVTIESQPLSDVSDTVTVAAEIDILNYFETLGL